MTRRTLRQSAAAVFAVTAPLALLATAAQAQPKVFQSVAHDAQAPWSLGHQQVAAR